MTRQRNNTPGDTMNATTLENTLANNSNTDGARILGDIVCWSMRGSVPRDVAEQSAAAHGIDGYFTFPKVMEVNAWRRAVRDAVKGGAKDTKRFDVVKTRDDADYVIHEIIERRVEDGASSNIDDRHAEAHHVVSVRFKKAAYLARAFNTPDELIEAEDWTNPIAADIYRIYHEQLDNYTITDIRSRFQDLFADWAGIRLNEAGGVWFIPAIHADRVRAWQGWMTDMGHGAFVAPQIDAADTMAMVEAVGRDSLDAQLADLLDEIEKFKADTKVRPSTLEARVDAFDALRERVECYETMLGVALGELKGQTDAAQAALVEMVTKAHAEADKAREEREQRRRANTATA
jgi:hypothetical protein